jgi:hypothetical protein
MKVTDLKAALKEHQVCFFYAADPRPSLFCFHAFETLKCPIFVLCTLLCSFILRVILAALTLIPRLPS